jgi:SAM-dependent methyltransferase
VDDVTRLRAEREKTAFDTTNVSDNIRRLHRRFSHVFESPNTLYGERESDVRLAALCRDATVLDYGCSNGWAVPQFREWGARRIIGIDISEVLISEARSKHGNLAEFHACDAQNIAMLEDSSVDVIYGRAILHHLDFVAAMNEVQRVLRKGGTALFLEPLFDNPVSILFRKLTPKARTVDERPLSRIQIAYADRLFSSSNHRFCNLVTTPVGMITSLLPLQADNAALVLADRIDRKLEHTPLRYWMRLVHLCWVK